MSCYLNEFELCTVSTTVQWPCLPGKSCLSTPRCHLCMILRRCRACATMIMQGSPCQLRLFRVVPRRMRSPKFHASGIRLNAQDLLEHGWPEFSAQCPHWSERLNTEHMSSEVWTVFNANPALSGFLQGEVASSPWRSRPRSRPQPRSRSWLLSRPWPCPDRGQCQCKMALVGLVTSCVRCFSGTHQPAHPDLVAATSFCWG